MADDVFRDMVDVILESYERDDELNQTLEEFLAFGERQDKLYGRRHRRIPKQIRKME